MGDWSRRGSVVEVFDGERFAILRDGGGGV